MKRLFPISIETLIVVILFLMVALINLVSGQNSNVSPVANLTTSNDPSYFAIEAESMNLTNYIINTNPSASGGSLIKLNTASSGNPTGSATCTFAGTTDTYDIKVWYYDENDGACTFNIYVAGAQVCTWVANQNLGSADPVAATRTSQIITDVAISNGDQIKLEAIQNAQEWGRYDLVEIYTHGYKPPSIIITSPANNAVFNAGDNITIVANATATCGIAKVEFYQSTTKLGESTKSPYTYTWNNVSAGSYRLTATVTDSCGVTQTSKPVNITVMSSQGAVVVNITTPFAGATLRNVVAVNARAYDTHFGTNDGAGISEVQFYLLQDTTVFASHQELTASYDWSLDVAGLATGDYILQAKAFSISGDSAISQINVHVIGNTRPANNWLLTFSDEFYGTGAPDPVKWDRPEYNRRDNSGGPDGWWSQEDSYLDGNGNLVIRIRKIPNKNADSDPYDYSVGAIRTFGKFAQKYGKFEMRAQLPTQQGWWVAFWMMQGNQGSVGNGGVDGSEVDIVEAWGWTDKINHAIHWDGYGSAHQSVGTSDYPPGIREGFHTYTLIWDPEMYYFYIDGVEVWRTTGGGVCNQAGYIKITGECSTEAWAIDKSWSKDPASATFPDYFLVDWVRVYQAQGTNIKNSSAALPTEFALDQNYPNPFNLETNIRYQLPEVSSVQLEIYDITGCKIRVLVNAEQSAGSQTIRWDRLNELRKPVSSGIYLYCMKATSANRVFKQGKRMLLLK